MEGKPPVKKRTSLLKPPPEDLIEKGGDALQNLLDTYTHVENLDRELVKTHIDKIIELKSRKVPFSVIYQSLKNIGLRIKPRTLQKYIIELTPADKKLPPVVDRKPKAAQSSPSVKVPAAPTVEAPKSPPVSPATPAPSQKPEQAQAPTSPPVQAQKAEPRQSQPTLLAKANDPAEILRKWVQASKPQCRTCFSPLSEGMIVVRTNGEVFWKCGSCSATFDKPYEQ
jgi:hypothetical protein